MLDCKTRPYLLWLSHDAHPSRVSRNGSGLTLFHVREREPELNSP